MTRCSVCGDTRFFENDDGTVACATCGTVSQKHGAKMIEEEEITFNTGPPRLDVTKKLTTAFNYEAYAKEYGVEAADEMRKKQTLISDTKKLLKRRRRPEEKIIPDSKRSYGYFRAFEYLLYTFTEDLMKEFKTSEKILPIVGTLFLNYINVKCPECKETFKSESTQEKRKKRKTKEESSSDTSESSDTSGDSDESDEDEDEDVDEDLEEDSLEEQEGESKSDADAELDESDGETLFDHDPIDRKNNQNDKAPSKKTPLTSIRKNNKDEIDEVDDSDGNDESVQNLVEENSQPNEEESHKDVNANLPRLYHILGFSYLACLLLREPLLEADILNFVYAGKSVIFGSFGGKLMALNTYILKEIMMEMRKMRKKLSVDLLLDTTADMCRVLDISPPSVNYFPILPRIYSQMRLDEEARDEVHTVVQKILSLYTPPFMAALNERIIGLSQVYSQNVYSSGVYLMAVVVVALKIVCSYSDKRLNELVSFWKRHLSPDKLFHTHEEIKEMPDAKIPSYLELFEGTFLKTKRIPSATKAEENHRMRLRKLFHSEEKNISTVQFRFSPANILTSDYKKLYKYVANNDETSKSLIDFCSSMVDKIPKELTRAVTEVEGKLQMKTPDKKENVREDAPSDIEGHFGTSQMI